MHLTDEQLNEYLDNETNEREQIELHLNTCHECSARFSDLQNLFLELDSLPDLQLTRDLSKRFNPSRELIRVPTRWFNLTVFAQATIALVALIIAIPFIAIYLQQIDTTMLATSFAEVQTLWKTWLDVLSTFEFESTIFELPTLPIVEMSSLLISLAGIFIVWIFGNGILLRNQIRR